MCWNGRITRRHCRCLSLVDGKYGVRVGYFHVTIAILTCKCVCVCVCVGGGVQYAQYACPCTDFFFCPCKDRRGLEIWWEVHLITHEYNIGAVVDSLWLRRFVIPKIRSLIPKWEMIRYSEGSLLFWSRKKRFLIPKFVISNSVILNVSQSENEKGPIILKHTPQVCGGGGHSSAMHPPPPTLFHWATFSWRQPWNHHHNIGL